MQEEGGSGVDEEEDVMGGGQGGAINIRRDIVGNYKGHEPERVMCWWGKSYGPQLPHSWTNHSMNGTYHSRNG